MRTNLQGLLASGQPVVLDGAMGTMLFRAGLKNGESPELWNVEQAEKVAAVHRAYIEAGSQLILTNTFGCNRERLKLHRLEARAAEFNHAAARLARAVADAAPSPVLVAGSIGPTGSMMAPLGDLTFEAAVALFSEQARALAEGGVDVLWVETMSDLEEVRAAVQACHEAAPDLPVVATMTFDTHGRTMMGVKPEQAVKAITGLAVLAVGGNCGNGPDEIAGVIEKMHAAAPDAVLVAKANAGIPRLVDDVAVYDATPAHMAEYALQVRGLGATLIGGCCGSTPDHIRAMAQALHPQH